ncbi:uncharacterized protein LOC143210658 isoform X2 [Lasioglossum baleicum]|uniref:uncharacterized protein LOC143210658 isoform X2 n=1 Tax=Lasioglossum baleicum TaxID=434251 RepID=UPI003FCC674E
MSALLSNEAQLRYVIEWFQEWSEMQRSDFMSILLEQCGPAGLVNGLVPRMETLGCAEGSDRPPSIFQCRIKLFREWSTNWSQQEKDSLISSIKNTDPVFAEKYEEKLSSLDTNVFEIASDTKDYNEQNENEMIQPVDLAILKLYMEDESRYKPLHSLVENYNKRNSVNKAQVTNVLNQFEPIVREDSAIESKNEAFVAGFKEDLDKIIKDNKFA